MDKDRRYYLLPCAADLSLEELERGNAVSAAVLLAEAPQTPRKAHSPGEKPRLLRFPGK